ncbi:unnamed protein product [Rhizophagus irregularis]|uniref:Kinase-like protein n=1 Tax=Rhizophagus irregularis TaxID=588596 RepID=A0A2I1H396_9GLOM|nr:kinase-like protein [Rhizophagus irregularis]CAB4414754.1 unnamed protein product [Rhizophagus irregularis]
MEKQHVLELFKLREKNPQINCNFRTSESEFLKKLDPERIRYLKTELESFSAPNCDLNLPYICDNCLHRVLHGKFSSWASGNELIDSFIQETQLSSSYERYPEWVPYNSLSQIKKIGEGGFGTVFSAMWSWGIKGIKTKDLNMHYRTGPCKVALKKLKGEMEITQTFLSEVQAQFDFCHLYGITQDPETLEYMFIMRLAPQGDLRTYLLRNFNNLSLPNKLGIAQTICAELKKIHARGWVHGDLHSGNILLLNEENAFISDFGMCRPIDAVKSKDKLYGVIPNLAPEIFRRHPYSQAGDIYSLGIILWELVCGVIAYSDRSHDVHLIVDICDGLRPQTCYFAPPVYNDLLKRCWDQDPLKRPSIEEILNSIEFWCFHRKQCDILINNIDGEHLFRSGISYKDSSIARERIHDENDRFGDPQSLNYRIKNQFANSQNAGYIYILIGWKPNKHIHTEAVYTSRSFSYKSLQDDIDIFLSRRKSNQKSNQSSIVK